MAEKLCVFCKHLEHESGGYGEYAEADKFYCGKGKWAGRADEAYNQLYNLQVSSRRNNDVDCDDLDVFRVLIRVAETCDSYDPAG